MDILSGEGEASEVDCGSATPKATQDPGMGIFMWHLRNTE